LPALLIFDAKYRLSASGSVPDDALSDGYTYLGSIGHASGKRAVWAALVCFPGSGPAEHYASGVGLLPLRPGHTEPLNEWLPTFLASSDAPLPIP
jgi:hypothetical protein